MITVEIKLTSFHGPQHDQELGTMIIDNLGGSNSVADYRARMYPKGAMKKHGNARALVANATAHREGFVKGHRRLAEPVGNLVAKALKEMGYK